MAIVATVMWWSMPLPAAAADAARSPINPPRAGTIGIAPRAGSPVRAPIRWVAAVDSFSPPPPAAPNKAKKRRAPAAHRPSATGTPAPETADGEPDREEAPPPRRAPAAVAPRRRPPPKAETPGEEGSERDEADEDGSSKIKRAGKRARSSSDEDGSEDGETDDEDEADDGALTSLAPVRPRLVTFELGGSLLGRTFAFDAPLQRESTFPRAGGLLSLEAYPLLGMSGGWWRRLGVGANLGMEFGSAALKNAASGVTASIPVTQRRIGFDVRYAITAGDHLVIVPALGLGNHTFDLKTNMPVAPSACGNTAATPTDIVVPCIADVQATYLTAALHVRVAISGAWALSLSGGYDLGLAVGRGLGQIGQERTPRVSGLRAELGASLMVLDWLAVRGAIPFNTYSYTFSGGTATYASASETYYGLTVSALIFTR